MKTKLFIPGLLLLLIMLTGAGCSQETPAPLTSDGIDFDMNLELVLEFEELVFPNNPYPSIQFLRPYGESGFIAYNSFDKQILQLDREGNVVQRMGREGRGPGEFLGIWNVIPLRDGRIGVSDLNNARYIIFDAEGNAVMHIDMQPEDPSLTGPVHPLEDGGYLNTSYRRLYERVHDCIFVELDEDLRALDPCYGSYNALNESDNKYLRQKSQRSILGDIHFIGEDRFMFVRSNYDGTHYFYRRTVDNWVIDSTATGYVRVPASVTNTTYIPLGLEPGNPQIPDNLPSRPPNYIGQNRSEEGSTAVIWHNTSSGYSVYNDRYLLHFTVIDPGGDARIPGVELWTTDGTYLGYKRLDDLLEQYGFNENDLERVIRDNAFNDGRLLLATTTAVYLFDVELVVSDRMAEDSVDR